MDASAGRTDSRGDPGGDGRGAVAGGETAGGDSYDLVILGGGTAGLVAAAGSASLGARVALVERDRLGGECLWTGCVPSKALIGSARIAEAFRRAGDFGLSAVEPRVDGSSVLSSVRDVRARIQPHDDPERFRQMGVDVVQAHARFLTEREVEAGDRRLRSRKFLVATGSRPAVPPVEGMDAAGYVTHETAFDRDSLPSSAVILGGGAIGVEFAQAYRRLGVEVTLVEMEERVLPREDEEMSWLVEELLEEEGVRVLTGRRAVRAGRDGELRELELRPVGARVAGTRGGRGGSGASAQGKGAARGPDARGGSGDAETVTAHELFVATGRAPNVEEVGLEAAGVEAGPGGIEVDDKLRTTRSHVFAAGDVIGPPQFTHVADHEARTVVRNALFPFHASVDYSVIPWAVFTDPALARVGLTEAEARERHPGRVQVFRYDLRELDRAVTERSARGLVKIITDAGGHILGGHVHGHSAGTMIMEVALAMREDVKLGELSDLVHPYPTMSEGVRRAANEYQRARLTPRTRRWLDRWFRLARTLGP